MASSTVPRTMRAWTYSSHGAPSSVLKLSTSHPAPTPSATQCVVRVAYSALNPVCYKVMSQMPGFLVKKPAVAEHDFSGEIVQRGTSVRDALQVGDAVFGIVPPDVHAKTGRGTMAEFALVDQDHLVKKPENVSFEDAGGLALTGMTAYDALLVYGKLTRGQKVLVNGGSGGVGVIAVQMAKAIVGDEGMVVATCSDANVDLVKSLGADEVVDYKKHSPLPAYLKQAYGDRPFDLIFDTIGVQDLYVHCADYLAPGKLFINIGMDPSSFGELLSVVLSILKNLLLPTWLGGTPRTYKVISMKPGTDKLMQIKSWAEEGKIKGAVDSVYPLEDAPKAYERMMSHRAKGKIMVKVQDM